MRTVVSLPAWLLVVGSLVVGGADAVGSRSLLRRWLGDERSNVAAVAGPLMPALGAMFALLAALALSNEAAQLRTADQDVSLEAAAASRLAWASTTPGVDPELVQRPLADYLRSTRATEWEGTGGTGSPQTFRILRDLETNVRAEAAGSELGSAQAGELLGSLDSVTSLRRQRLATRSHQLPDLYLLVVVASGLALIINSAALARGRARRVAAVTAGVVVVVSLVLALLLSITSPFVGGFQADGRPIDAVSADLESGVFVP